MLRIALILGVIVFVSACSSLNTVSQNDSHITIKFAVGDYDEAQAAARKHCARYGKAANHTGTTCPSDSRCMSNYECR